MTFVNFLEKKTQKIAKIRNERWQITVKLCEIIVRLSFFAFDWDYLDLDSENCRRPSFLAGLELDTAGHKTTYFFTTTTNYAHDRWSRTSLRIMVEWTSRRPRRRRTTWRIYGPVNCFPYFSCCNSIILQPLKPQLFKRVRFADFAPS